MYIYIFERGNRPYALSAQPSHFQVRSWGLGRLSGLSRLTQLVTDKPRTRIILKIHMTGIFIRTSISTKPTYIIINWSIMVPYWPLKFLSSKYVDNSSSYS